MQASTLSRTLLVSLALVIAGPALAQGSDRDASSPRQTSARSPVAKAAAARRLDVPATAVKPTTTRTPASSTQQPAAERMHDGTHCDHSLASDA